MPYPARRPFVTRLGFLALAALWGGAGIAVVLTLHVNPAHQMTMTGQPVTHTVYLDNPTLWVANFVGIGLVLAVALVELLWRKSTGRTGPGQVAITLGTAVALYSLFGLLYGIVAIGPIAALVIGSGTPMTSDRDLEAARGVA